MRCNDCMYIPAHCKRRIWLASVTQDQKASLVFLSLRMGVAGPAAHPRVDWPIGNTPAIPDGTLPLTSNLMNWYSCTKLNRNQII